MLYKQILYVIRYSTQLKVALYIHIKETSTEDKICLHSSLPIMQLRSILRCTTVFTCFMVPLVVWLTLTCKLIFI